MSKMTEEFKFLSEVLVVEAIETMTNGAITGNMLVVRLDKKAKTIFVGFNARIPVSTAFRINVKNKALYVLKNSLNHVGVIVDRVYFISDAGLEKYMFVLSKSLLELSVDEFHIESALTLLRYTSNRNQALETLINKYK